MGYDTDQNHIGPLISFFQASPNLQSLSLNLRDHHDIGNTWSLTPILSALGNVTFPSLHTFRALGAAAHDWYSFFDSPDSDPMRAFFIRHPGLRTIGFGSVLERAYYGDMSPDDMATLFPSLTHIETPIFLCIPIITSSLANQIQSLTIVDVRYEGTTFDLDLIAGVVKDLPKLRVLKLCIDEEDEISSEALRKVLAAAKGLQELEFMLGLNDPVCPALSRCYDTNTVGLS
jgi:hypothetical protein